MASVDIRDACYTLPIVIEHQQYLKFAWKDKLYRYTGLPNGLASAPRIFTKLLKPVLKELRQKGHLSSSYIDDCYLQGEPYGECHVDTSSKFISHGEPELLIQTDASSHGWGGVRGDQRTGGKWTQEEASHHINYLELLAVLLTSKALCGECASLHIRIQCDNTTAVCYINNMGGSKSPDCDSVSRKIWDHRFEHNTW